MGEYFYSDILLYTSINHECGNDETSWAHRVTRNRINIKQYNLLSAIDHERVFARRDSRTESKTRNHGNDARRTRQISTGS